MSEARIHPSQNTQTPRCLGQQNILFATASPLTNSTTTLFQSLCLPLYLVHRCTSQGVTPPMSLSSSSFGQTLPFPPDGQFFWLYLQLGVEYSPLGCGVLPLQTPACYRVELFLSTTPRGRPSYVLLTASRPMRSAVLGASLPFSGAAFMGMGPMNGGLLLVLLQVEGGPGGITFLKLLCFFGGK